jgi:hypothetical protein
LHTCQPSYSPTKTSDSKPLWMSCLWASLLLSRVPEPAHAIITRTKVNLLGLTPSHRICDEKSCITFSNCPSFTYFVRFWFHAKMFNYTVPGAIVAISAATHGGFHQSSSQSASHVFLCLKSGYLSFVYSRNLGQVDQPWSPHNPGTNGIIRKEKATLTFSINILHLTYRATATIPPVQRTWKEIFAKFSPVQDSHQERATQWHQQELWLHWHVNSNRFDVHLPSLICDPTIVNDPKRTPGTVSLSNLLQGLQKKTSFQIM